MPQPVVLIIRDGWGVNPDGRAGAARNGDATLLARTPFHDELTARYPQGRLQASGEVVGLPAGQMGNSEVGHLNLGAGRIVDQDLTRIDKAIAAGEFSRNPVLQAAFAQARPPGRRLHLLGLVSDGGVHSHQDHLVALARAARAAGVGEVWLHAFTDGRDTSPTSGADALGALGRELAPLGVRVATVIGRYFAMDRDNRWDRTRQAWDAIVLGQGTHPVAPGAEGAPPGPAAPAAVVRALYAQGKTDEFLPPQVFVPTAGAEDQPLVRDGDVVLFGNFRADRTRQLSRAFLQESFDQFPRPYWPRVHYVTLTQYDATYACPFVFAPTRLTGLLGEVVSAAGKKQLRIAETEKYPHVTYFFNGGREAPDTGEDRQIIPSPKVATYDLQPAMSAPEVTRQVVAALERYDLVILNFANPDMVGHTGVVEAAVHAVETIDDAVRQVVERTLALGGKLLITADHGNCELLRNPDGSPNTAHTTNLVQCFYAAADAARFRVRDGILADVAPTLLFLLGLPRSAEMTGRNLLEEKS